MSKKQQQGNIGIAIQGPPPESIKALHAAIVAVLNCKVEQETLRAALKVLENGTSVRDVSVSNTSISMGDAQ